MHNQYPIESGFNYAFSKTQEIKPSDSDIDINENNKLICKIEDLKNLIDDPKSIILDTRSLDEYTGANSRGNKRIGHVPGAINIEWLENIYYIYIYIIYIYIYICTHTRIYIC